MQNAILSRNTASRVFDNGINNYIPMQINNNGFNYFIGNL